MQQERQGEIEQIEHEVSMEENSGPVLLFILFLFIYYNLWHTKTEAKG